MDKNISEFREKQEIYDEIRSLYEEIFDAEKNDLEDLTIGELKEYLEELSSKGPIILNIKDLLKASDIDFDGFEEMELNELLELEERLQNNIDK